MEMTRIGPFRVCACVCIGTCAYVCTCARTCTWRKLGASYRTCRRARRINVLKTLIFAKMPPKAQIKAQIHLFCGKKEISASTRGNSCFYAVIRRGADRQRGINVLTTLFKRRKSNSDLTIARHLNSRRKRAIFYENKNTRSFFVWKIPPGRTSRVESPMPHAGVRFARESRIMLTNQRLARRRLICCN